MRKNQQQSAHQWQTGEYQRHAAFRFTLPQQFLLLCKLMEVTPHELLTDFMDNLSCGSWKRQGREEARQRLLEYFLANGYGQQYFSTGEIREIFRELDAIGVLYPSGASADLIAEHCKWRDHYQEWWFSKWFEKDNRLP